MVNIWVESSQQTGKSIVHMFGVVITCRLVVASVDVIFLTVRENDWGQAGILGSHVPLVQWHSICCVVIHELLMFPRKCSNWYQEIKSYIKVFLENPDMSDPSILLWYQLRGVLQPSEFHLPRWRNSCKLVTHACLLAFFAKCHPYKTAVLVIKVVFFNCQLK